MSPQSTQISNRRKRQAKPLDRLRLEELGLAYVARFAVSAEKLRRYLGRKLRERGWEDDGDPPIEALAEKFVAAGYVDDALYARSKSGSLLRRGYGARRIDQALGQDGIDETLRSVVRPGVAEAREAALHFARKRRLGPFGPSLGGSAPSDRAQREKQVAAFIRAGHSLDFARAMVNAASEEAAVNWAARAEDG